MSLLLATAHLTARTSTSAALSPLIALLGGAVVVLCFGLLGSRLARTTLVPAADAWWRSATALGLTIWQWNTHKTVVSGALRIDDLALVADIDPDRRRGACAVLLAWRSLAAKEAAHGEFYALLLSSVAGMSLLAERPEHGRPVPRPGAPLDPALRAVRDRNAPRALARVGAEVSDRRLGRIGDARSTGWR